jgi:hypothetical protein
MEKEKKEIVMPSPANFCFNPMLGEIEWDYLRRAFLALQLNY